jgi:hypothetical protein
MSNKVITTRLWMLTETFSDLRHNLLIIIQAYDHDKIANPSDLSIQGTWLLVDVVSGPFIISSFPTMLCVWESDPCKRLTLSEPEKSPHKYKLFPTYRVKLCPGRMKLTLS